VEHSLVTIKVADELSRSQTEMDVTSVAAPAPSMSRLGALFREEELRLRSSFTSASSNAKISARRRDHGVSSQTSPTKNDVAETM
jgi:hypothetical protein